jgi:group I intron endonuclease
MKSGFIYWLHFPNGKGYIGQTRATVAARFASHKHDAATGKKGQALHDAWRKYGAPECVTLLECAIEDLNAREIAFIHAFETIAPKGYNLNSGGDAALNTHPATREKLAALKRGKKFGPHSPEHREKLRLATLNSSPEVKARRAAGLRIALQTPEYRANRSAAMMGHPVSAETREKIAASRRGDKHWSRKHPERWAAHMTKLRGARK